MMRRRLSVTMLLVMPAMLIALGVAITITGNHGHGVGRLYVGGAVIVLGAAWLAFTYRWLRRVNFGRGFRPATTSYESRHARDG